MSQLLCDLFQAQPTVVLLPPSAWARVLAILIQLLLIPLFGDPEMPLPPIVPCQRGPCAPIMCQARNRISFNLHNHSLRMLRISLIFQMNKMGLGEVQELA